MDKQKAGKELKIAVEKLIDEIAIHFRLYDILGWLNDKLK